MKKVLRFTYKLRHLLIALLYTFVVYWYYSVPEKLFDVPYATAIYDNNGQLLFAKISEDGQWRFPPSDEVPEKIATCLIAFEDRNFYSHWGLSVKGLLRATYQNLSEWRKVSGGSTLTMQLARLSKGNQDRTFGNKISEIIMATRIESKMSKDSILSLYCAHAPMGGNVVGIEAAAWRYFGKPARSLSWAESAVLAVLPNAPALIHPGRNRNALRLKRNRLLKYLYESGQMDELTYELSIQEEIPEEPLPLPQKIPHLFALAHAQEQDKMIHSTIDPDIQGKVEHIMKSHHLRLSANEINNLAALVMDVNTGNVLAYVGNIVDQDEIYEPEVDLIQAPRSSGSILKPLLFAMAVDKGVISAQSLIEDVPSYYQGYRPQNYSETYDGLVAANEALARSLNVPFVRLLDKVGVAGFLHYLKKMGFSTITKGHSHYGLSLILGGAEVSLWDLVTVYRALAKQLKTGEKKHTSYIFEGIPFDVRETFFSDFAIWQTFSSMLESARPGEELLWEQFNTSQRIAWKTGTSFGYRDAWSVGVTADYVVGVWVGNADGEGRPGIVGREAAAPVLFDIFRMLPASEWFKKPEKFLLVEACAETGYLASSDCPEKRWMEVPLEVLNPEVCKYHKSIFVTPDGAYRVFKNCSDPESSIKVKTWDLPPLVERYYQYQNPRYKKVPPIHPDCRNETVQEPMEWVYPKSNSIIYIPLNFEEVKEKMVMEITHKNPKIAIHWHLNEKYLDTTEGIHKLEISPRPGKYTVTAIDENGVIISRNFEIVSR